MSTNDSPSLNSNRKLTASFSSPEFNESVLSTSVDASESSTAQASASGTGRINTNVITTSNSNSMIKNTNTGIKLNTTRDSGFSDSLIEDSTSSSNSTQFLTRSEHLINTTIDAKSAKLNSVEEDKDNELSKEFITIVKTTKVTTKVKHIKNPKNKKNKKKQKEIENIDENKQLAEVVTEIITENESTLSANLNGSNNQLLNGNIQASNIVSKTITQTTNGSNDNKMILKTHEKIDEDEEITSNSSTSNPNDIFDEEDEEDSQIAELNGLKMAKKNNAVIKVNINKSTEELVFQALPPPKTSTKQIIEEQKDSLATTTYSTTQHLSTTLSSDLNTSILDSEELLSDYSIVNNPNQLDQSTNNKTTDLNASLASSSIKEIPNVIDFVLSDVTNEQKTEVKTETLINGQSNGTTKVEKKKKKTFNLFSKSTESKRKLSKKDDLLQESPSKQAKKENDILTKKLDDLEVKNILSIYDNNQTASKYRLLDEEQKDRIIYMKQECVDLLMNDFLQFESNSNSKTQLTNIKNQPYLNIIIRKMIARSLDLLRHDKIESFDKLAAQLKQEYKINDLNEDEIVEENFDFNNVNLPTSDLIFKRLIKEALIDNKILLKLNFDKSKCRPYEEVIEFNTGKSVPISKPIQVIRKQEEFEPKIVINPEPVVESVNKIEVEIVQELAKPVQVEENELKVQIEEGARIVLDTIKEPPIVFPSELDPSLRSPVIVAEKVAIEEIVLTPPVSQSTPSQTAVTKTNKKPKKNQKAKKNSAISCIACGANSMRKSDDDLNKTFEINIPKTDDLTRCENAPVFQESKPQAEYLKEVHQALFSNLDPLPVEKQIDEEAKTEETIINEPMIVNEDLPQPLNVEVEVNVMKDEPPALAEPESMEIAPTTFTSSNDLEPEQIHTVPDQASEVILPAAELKQTVEKVKKGKKNKKEKMQITNEIQLTSSGIIDVSVIDVKIEAFTEPENKVESETIDEPVKIAIRNIHMEDEQAEVERKSFSEIFEITQTITHVEDNQIEVLGSNLDIKTEIDIGIEKEILKEEIQVSEPKLESPEVKPKLSDDIVKLPERDENIQTKVAVAAKVNESVKVDTELSKPTVVKKEKKTKASCFSCKARKANKTKADAKQPIVVAETSNKTNPPLATAEEESKTIESPQLAKGIKPTESVNSNLFIGLDRRSSQKPLDAPSIYTIDLNEKVNSAYLKSEQGVDSITNKDSDNNLITPSLIGSTSIEGVQVFELINATEIESEIKVVDVQKTSVVEALEKLPVETRVEIIETPVVVDIVEIEQKKEKKVLSDDIVVLPDPALVKEQTLPEAPKVELNKVNEPISKPDTKRKKKKSASCFPGKEKKEKSIKTDLPQEKEKASVKINISNITDVVDAKVSATVPEHKITENWSVGLDRKDEDVVLRKDPVDFISVVNENPTQENIEVPTDKEIIPEESEKEVEKNQATNELNEQVISISQIKNNLTEGSWVVIDREPDHAYIPIVTNDNVLVKSSIIVSKPDVEVKTNETINKQKDEKPRRKTTRIDLPLINICGSTETKKKDKKKKTKKSQEKAEVSKKGPTTGVLDMPLIDIFSKKSKEIPESPKTELIETIINSESENKEISQEVALAQVETIENKTELPEVKIEAVEESEVIAQHESTEESKPSVRAEEVIEELKPETIIESATIIENPEKNENKDEPLVHIKLDREPDIVKLPERDDSKLNIVSHQIKPEDKKPEVQAVEIKTKTTKKISDEKSSSKRTTSIFDMPLIDILVPNETKKREKAEKKNNKSKKPVSESPKKKTEIPELLIIDVPTLEIFKSEIVSPKELSIKEEIKSNFDAKIPVAETSVDNFNIKINEDELPSVQINTSEIKIETKAEDLEAVPSPLEKTDQEKIDDGSWVIIDRQPDPIFIPVVASVIQQSTVEKPAETLTTTSIVPEIKRTDEIKSAKTKKVKAKKPASCFSRKSKQKQAEELKNEPIKAETKKAETIEVKKEVIANNEIHIYDFTGLDRRDSQTPIQQDESVVQSEPVSVKTEPKLNENIEKIIKEELNEVDKQYPELNKLPGSIKNVQIVNELVDQVVSIVSENEIIVNETAEKVEIFDEVQLKTIENEEDEATKKLDDVLENAENELKKLDESFDIKPLIEEIQVSEPKLESPEVKPKLSDDIVKLPERDENIQTKVAVAAKVNESVKVDTELSKPTVVKKEKKTKASCFSCKAKKSKENKDNLPQITVQNANLETKTEQQISPVSFNSHVTYDANLFKGLDRPNESEPIKEPVNLDLIRVEPIKNNEDNRSDVIFHQVIQEIIIETSQSPEKPQVEVVEIKQKVEQAELEVTTNDQNVVLSTHIDKKAEVLADVSIEIPISQNLNVPQSSTPKKLSDDIVVLPEPPVRTQLLIQKSATEKTEAAPLTQNDDTKVKKQSALVTFLCGNKTKKSIKDKKNKTPSTKAQQIAINETVKLSVEDAIKTHPTIQITTLDNQNTLNKYRPVISAQPPKKPPRGNLDISVHDNDIDFLIPKSTTINEQVIVEDSKPLEVDTTCSPSIDVSHVLLDPQMTQPLVIDVKTPSNNRSSVVEKLSEQQVLTTKVTTSLLSTTESNNQITKSTTQSIVTETKLIEIPSVLDIDTSTNLSKRITTWSTDPLPHVQIGLHKIDFTEPDPSSTLQKTPTSPAKPIETKKTETIQPVSTLTVTNENETIKKFTNEERKLIKSKQSLVIEYLKQQAGYSTSSSSTKHEKEKEKIANKLFKKGIKIATKNDSKPVTYTKLNKKLEKEVSTKKYSTEITNCLNQLREQLETGSLLNYLQNDKTTTPSVPQIIATEVDPPKTNIVFNNIDLNINESSKEKSSSTEKLDKVEHPTIMKRFPSLTWREANERARILFYKGRVPSIHYNEKRDSFRVSMLTSVSTNGTEKTTEVPVCDDDVRRLLNSCGLYWNGESISLLNKSDDIFSIAQQEAFDILQLINSNK